MAELASVMEAHVCVCFWVDEIE